MQDQQNEGRYEAKGIRLTQSVQDLQRNIQRLKQSERLRKTMQNWRKMCTIDIKGVRITILRKGAKLTKRCKIDKKGRIDTTGVKFTQTQYTKIYTSTKLAQKSLRIDNLGSELTHKNQS